MAAPRKLTPAEVEAIHWHLDREIAGHVAAKEKWELAKKTAPLESIARSIEYERWAIAALKAARANAKAGKGVKANGRTRSRASR